MFNPLELMKKAQEMQEAMQKLQEEMGRRQITAEAGGMVQATVNGKLELIKLKIDKSKIDLSDIELLEDVIVAAVHGAQERAAQVVAGEMQKQAGALGLPPGMLPEM